jgi:hypothetical protein
MTARRRRRAGIALVVLTALLLAATAVCGYVRSALVDEHEFSARATSALENADVRSVVADRVVDGLTRNVVPDVLTVRPLVVPAVAALVNTSPFRRLFAQALSDRHRALINGHTSFRFEIPLGKGVVFESLQSVAPRIAGAIPRDLRVPVVRLDPQTFELAGARFLTGVAGLWWPLLILSALAAAGCAVLAGGTRSALLYLGIALAGAGLIVAAAVAGLDAFVVAHASHAADLSEPVERAAVHALWDALFADLRSAALLAALGGALVTVLAAGTVSRRLPGALWERGRRGLSSPRPAARLARGAGLIALGAALVLAPGLVGRVVLLAGGVLIALTGAAQLSGGGGEERPAAAPASATPLPLIGAIAAVLAITAVAAAIVLPAPRAPGPVADALASAGACNGSRALCGRRLNEVVFPTTHNAFAAADEPGWLFANQNYGIARQLRDGIRGFMIDIHDGVRDPARGVVRTDLTGENSSRNKVTRQLGPRAVRTADRLAGRVGASLPTGKRSPYLCHTLCELGSEPLTAQLKLFASFLQRNRREVVILFVEPYVPAATLEQSLDEAGLLRQAAALKRDEPLPTLGELIRKGTRVVILTEKDGGARPWYLPGFSFVQDTPLGARNAKQLVCGLNRGSADSPLLLINHWIDGFPPSPSRNERVGGSVLERQVDRCERARGQLPNLIAVDFYERTRVLAVARRLNARPG